LVDVVKGSPPMFPAGEQMYYSNTNTVALGMVIEKVTGEPIGEVLTNRILQPLGLTQTSWPGESHELPQPSLSGVTEQGEPEGMIKDATKWNPSWAFTAGEMVSTLDDLHTWGRSLGTGEGIMDSKTQELRLQPLDDNASIPPNKTEPAYGIGFGRENGWIGHTGELTGYNTSVQCNPDTSTTVVVMVNSDIPLDDENPAPTVMKQLQIVLEAAGTANGDGAGPYSSN
jgi:D-alanyl-D-alanine carboxypeptidase